MIDTKKVCEGKNVLFDLLIGDEYVELGCLISCDINVTVELIPITTVGSGRWRKYTSRFAEWGGSADMVTMIIPGGLEKDVFYLLNNPFEPLNIRYTFVNKAGDWIYLTGQIWTEDLNLGGAAGDLSQSDFSFRGNGEYTLTDVATGAILDTYGNLIYSGTNQIGNEITEP